MFFSKQIRPASFGTQKMHRFSLKSSFSSATRLFSKDSQSCKTEFLDRFGLQFDESEGCFYAYKCHSRLPYGGLTNLNKIMELFEYGNPETQSAAPNANKLVQRFSEGVRVIQKSLDFASFGSYRRGESNRNSTADISNISTTEKSGISVPLNSGESLRSYRLDIAFPDISLWGDCKEVFEKYNSKFETKIIIAPTPSDSQCATASSTVVESHDSPTPVTSETKAEFALCEQVCPCESESTTDFTEPGATAEVEKNTLSEEVFHSDEASSAEDSFLDSESTASFIEQESAEAQNIVSSSVVTRSDESSQSEVSSTEEGNSSPSDYQPNTDSTEHEESAQVADLASPEETDQFQASLSSSCEESTCSEDLDRSYDFDCSDQDDGPIVGRELSIKFNTGRLFNDQEEYVDADTGVEYRFNQWGDPEELVPYGFKRLSSPSNAREPMRSVIRNLDRRPQTTAQYSTDPVSLEDLRKANLRACKREASILNDCVSSSESIRADIALTSTSP
ncbi:hypothetical protein G9P44_004786 [Scheffersomyces stipitis]|nr:hypothetical protein G9P44_004786 [Scheffersomyces stipitis]